MKNEVEKPRHSGQGAITDHSDLIAELRALADCDSRAGEPLGKCMRRAADKIERLAEHVDYIERQLDLITLMGIGNFIQLQSQPAQDD